MTDGNAYPISTRIAAKVRNLVDNPARLMPAVGQLLVSLSKRAFRDQRFGEMLWPSRYPTQAPPKINIAGAVQDLGHGPNVKARRFQDRPALLDTGMLQDSIVAKPGADRVEVGSVMPYAKQHQVGGTSTQPITPAVRKNLGKFLKSAKGKPYRPKLGFLFQRKELKTKANARPFIGLTDEGRKRIVVLLEGELGMKAT
jgi:phage gpG-like protein